MEHHISRETPSLATVEACNALRAETFRKLPDTIELWRFREVLTKLGTQLGLSSGATLYALDLIGMLTEADWRGDGRAVTYHSVRGYARKVGKAERTIGEYERQLVAAGLVHRTVKHARRHGGSGNARRRTGLDWRCFGARMPQFLEALATRRAYEEHRLDIEARIHAERRIVLGLTEGMEEGRALDIMARLKGMGVLRLRGTISVADLQTRLNALTLLRAELTEGMPVDIPAFPAQGAEQSACLSGPIDITDNLPCPEDIRCARERSAATQSAGSTHPRRCSGKDGTPKGRAERESRIWHETRGQAIAVDLAEIWKAAPADWRRTHGEDMEISWPALVELADHIAPRLQVSPYAWSKALQVLGPCEAALALMVLDRNRDHPVRPVLSVGAALVGMVRRAGQGELNLVPSLYGIIARKKAAGGELPRRHG